MADTENKTSGIALSDAYTFKGRRQIFIDSIEIDRDNIVQILQECMSIHRQNVTEIQYLLDYERGIQPILDREKKVRSDINVKVVENGASQIVDFKLGYEFSQPITYVQRANKDSHGDHNKDDDHRISLLNEMMEEDGKAEKDLELARYFKICGVGHKLILPKQEVEDVAPFETAILDPRCAFVAYWNDAFKKPALGVSYVAYKDGSIRFGCYTKTHYFEIYNWKVVKTEINRIGEIPIVEYKNDYSRMECFERVIPLLNAINIINSDRINDIVQHVQALLWLNNAEIDRTQYDELKEEGIIQTKSNGNVQASIKYLESVLNQAETQTLVDYDIGRVLEITHVPNRQDPGGGSTTGSTNLSSGWMDADMSAKSAETVFVGSERMANKIVLSILRTHANVDCKMSDLKLTDIQVKFSRTKTYDLATKANAISTLLKSGINGLRVLETAGLFTDPQQVWEDSKEMIEKIQDTTKKAETNEVDKRPEDFKLTDVKPQPSAVTDIVNE